MSRVPSLQAMKQAGQKIVATTAYEHWSASILSAAAVDFLLVGDSVAMVVYGHPSTRAATVEMMRAHVEAVRRGAPDRMLVADVPWPAMEAGPSVAVAAGVALMESGADAVKVEALPGALDVVRRLRSEGIPVMGHVGLLPQTVSAPDGYRVRGRGDEGPGVEAAAAALQDADCFAVVLEAVPASLAGSVTGDLRIPTIGIGAGPGTDGQILVLHDLAGLTPGRVPRFVRHFGDGSLFLSEAVASYAEAVREGRFPGGQESYS